MGLPFGHGKVWAFGKMQNLRRVSAPRARTRIWTPTPSSLRAAHDSHANKHRSRHNFATIVADNGQVSGQCPT